MDETKPFDPVVAQTVAERIKEQRVSSALLPSVMATMQTNPDQEAEMNRMARDSGLPRMAVEADPREVANRIKLQRMNLPELTKQYPELAASMADPNFSSIAHDDLDGLRRLYTSVDMTRQPSQQSSLFQSMAANFTVQNSDMALIAHAFGHGDSQSVADYVASENRALEQIQRNAPAYVRQLERDKAAAGDSLTSYAGAYLKNLSASGRASLESLAGSSYTLAGTTVGAGAGAAVGSAVPAIGTAVGGIGGMAVGTATMSAIQNSASWLRQRLSERGVNLSDPAALKTALDDSDLMSELKAEAIRKGVVQGTLDGLFAVMGGKIATAPISGAAGRGLAATAGRVARRAGMAAGDVLVQSAGGALSEGVGQVAAVGKANPKDIVDEFLLGTFSEGADTAIGAAVRSPSFLQNRGAINAGQVVAQHQREQVAQVHAAAAGAKTLERDPDAVRAMVARQDPTGEVFIAPEAAKTYFQTLPPDRKDALTRAIPDLEQRIDNALSAGSDVVLPKSDYVAHIAGIPESEFLQDHVKFYADDQTVAQILADDRFREINDALESQANRQDDIESFANRLKNQLLDTGRVRGSRMVDAMVAPWVSMLRAARGREYGEQVVEKVLQSTEVIGPDAQPRPRALNDRDVELDKLRNEAIRRDRLYEAGQKRFKTRQAEYERRVKEDFAGSAENARLAGVKPPRVGSGRKGAKYPVLNFLRKRGGVNPDGDLAAFLRENEITPKVMPALFSRKRGALGAADGIPISEFESYFDGKVSVPVERGEAYGYANTNQNSYVQTDWLYEAIRDEIMGSPVVEQDVDPEQEAIDKNLEYFNQLGIDIKSMTNDEIQAALDGREGDSEAVGFVSDMVDKMRAIFGKTPETPATPKAEDSGKDVPAENIEVVQGQPIEVDDATLETVAELEQEQPALEQSVAEAEAKTDAGEVDDINVADPTETPATPETPITPENGQDAQATDNADNSITPDSSKTGGQQGGKIEDFGEKIEGARKDVWKDYKKAMSDALPDDLKDITLAKHFPEPAYDQLIANGVRVEVLAAIKAMRDYIPAKPRKDWKLQRWAKELTTFRDFANTLLQDDSGFDDFYRELVSAGKTDTVVESIKLYVSLGYPAFTKAAGYRIMQIEKALDPKDWSKGRKKLWAVLKDSSFIFEAEDSGSALEYLRAKLSIEPEPETATKSVKLDIYRMTSTGEVIIGKKVASGKFIDLKGGFKNAREAGAYLKENEKALLVLLERKKDMPPERRSVNDPRKGTDYRKGENVTPEKFAAEFGFRGVQFGNYVEQVRRTEDLNNAYDALLDMADVLGIPSRAISLEGKLGLAFGARGSGGKRPAKAHFEPTNLVINLTKNMGAGSLGHEWFHGFDNYFGQKQDQDFLTNAPRQRMKAGPDKTLVPYGTIRPELTEAFKGVMDAINKTDMLKRSRRADSTRSKDYWSTPIEMAARAFEAYLIYKAKEKGQSSDYLANVVDPAVYEAMGDAERYPYPLPDEMANTIAPAFDKLFSTLKTKKAEDGVTTILYQSAYHGSPYRFDKFSLEHMGKGEGAQAFGWGLYFAGKKELAEHYRQTLAPDVLRPTLEGKIVKIDDPLEKLAHRIVTDPKKYSIENAVEAGANESDIEKLKGIVADFLKKGAGWDYETKRGQLYKVSITEDDTMLLWDRPLIEQSDKVKSALEVVKKQLEDAGVLDGYLEIINADFDDLSGKELYVKILKRAHVDDALPADAKEYETSISNDEAASRYLNSIGIHGIKYLDGASRGSGDGSYNYVIFDDRAIDIVKTYYQEKRGNIRFMLDGRRIIQLLQDSNLSTFLHETGHAFLDIFHELSNAPDAPQQVKDDMAQILKFLGAESYDKVTVDHHETFARTFEAYLASGEAPSAALQRAFRFFKAWISNIYAKLTGRYADVQKALDVKVTPEIKAVLDRMLATDEEIELVSKATGFTLDEGVLSILPKADRERYQRIHQQSLESAKERLLARATREGEREATQWWKEERAKLHDDVTRSVHSDPVYRAFNWLKTGNFLEGDELKAPSERLRLSRKEIEELVGPEIIKKLPSSLFAKKGESVIRPDALSEVAAFNVGNPLEGWRRGTGKELIMAMAQAEPMKDRIERLTDETMVERHGNMLKDGSLGEKAQEVAENEFKAMTMEMEGRAAAELAKLRFPSAENMKVAAQKMIFEMKIQDAAAVDRFYRASVSSARLYGQAIRGKDWAKAVRYKRQQLLSHYLYREALEARDIRDKALGVWRTKLGQKDEKLAKSNDMNFVYAARAIMSKYGVLPFEQRYADYIEQVKQYDPEAAEDLITLVGENVVGAMPWRDMTYSQFIGLRDTVDNIIGVGKNSRFMEIDGQKRVRAEVRQELVDLIGKRVAAGEGANLSDGKSRRLTDGEKRMIKLYGARAQSRRVESWVKALDGEFGGIARKYLWNPINDARDNYYEARNEVFTLAKDVIDPHKERLLSVGKIDAPEIGYTFEDKGELISAVLNSANESNFERLLKGRNWSEEGWRKMMIRMEEDGTIVADDWELMTGLAKIVKSMLPAAQKAHKAMYGYYFSEVKPWQMESKFGTFDGWYWPVVYDKDLSVTARTHAEGDILKQNNATMFPSTGKGFTNKRVSNAPFEPVQLGLNVLSSHIDKVLRFTYLEPSVKDVAKLVTNPQFKAAIEQYDPKAYENMIRPWLQRVASQSVELKTGHPFFLPDSWWRRIRYNTAMQTMMLNLLNAIQQITGFSQSVYMLGPSRVGRALVTYMNGGRDMHKAMTETSTFMRHRSTVLSDHIESQVTDVLINKGKLATVQDAAVKHGYIFQRIFQGFVDTVTWTAAMEKATEQGMSHDEAVRYADSVIRDTQGSSDPTDISTVEAGAPFGRLFTMFYTYFNSQANTALTEIINMKRQYQGAALAGRMFYLYMMFVAVPAASAELIVRGIKGQLPEDDDDDGAVLDDWLSWFVGSQARYLTAMVPIVGQGGNAIIGVLNDNAVYNDRISGSPVITVAEQAVQAVNETKKAFEGKGDLSRWLQRNLTALGLFTGLPLGQLGKPLGYAADVAEGDAKPDGLTDVVSGVITGPPPANRR